MFESKSMFPGTMSPGEAAALSLERGRTPGGPDRGDAWVAALTAISRMPGAAGNDPSLDPAAAARALDVQAARAALGSLLDEDARLTLRLPDLIEAERLAAVCQVGVDVAQRFPGNRLSHAMTEGDPSHLPDEFRDLAGAAEAHSRPTEVLAVLDSIDVQHLTPADIGYLAGALLLRSGDAVASAKAMGRVLGAGLGRQVLEALNGALAQPAKNARECA